MTYEELENLRRHSGQVVKKICKKYGIYGNVIYDAPSPIPVSDRNRLYIVAGLDPAIGEDPPPVWLRPEEIIRRNGRNRKLFYPDIWVFDLYSNRNDMEAQQELIDYCKQARFIVDLYGEHGLEAPEKIRFSEIGQLREYHSAMEAMFSNDAVRSKCEKSLEWFFKREKSKNSFRQRWLSYFRSDRFPDGKNPFVKIRGYFKRKENVIAMDRFLEANGDFRKLQMQEYEYKCFSKFMQDCYPEVTYAVGPVEIVNHGLSKAAASADSPFGRAVTAEAFATIRQAHFAEDGYAVLENLRPVYWEFRDVYYKAVDEPLVAAAYNSVTLNYAKCNPLMEVKERGELALEQIPVNDFMNFVSLAKANGLRFYLDNLGDYATPSLKFVNVIYNQHQAPLLWGIMDRMIEDKADPAQIPTGERPALHSVIREAKHLPGSSTGKHRDLFLNDKEL